MSKLCRITSSPLCKLLELTTETDCSNSIKFNNITIERPVLVVICLLSFIVSLVSSFCICRDLNRRKKCKRRFEYHALFCSYAVWCVLVMLDRCFIINDSTKIKIVVFIEIFTSCVVCIILVETSIMEFSIDMFKFLKRVLRCIGVLLISTGILILLLIAYFTNSLFFQIVYFLCVISCLAIASTLYIVFLVIRNKQVFRIVSLVICVIVVVLGMISQLVFNPQECNFITKYFAGQEISMLLFTLSLWIYSRCVVMERIPIII